VHPNFPTTPGKAGGGNIDFKTMENDLLELENPTPKRHNTEFKKTTNNKTKTTKNQKPLVSIKKRMNRQFVFFVVHGLEATSFDMRQIRASILSSIPNASVCLIQKNNDLTNDSIQSQGKRLAEEILNLINSNNISGISI
jgi:hypothetical protein